MFEEFSKPSLKEWHAQLEKELKGASLESKDWVLADGTRSKAFHFPNQEYAVAPLVRLSSDWQICEDVEVNNSIKISNFDALKALEGGVEALSFTIGDTVDSNAIEQLFEGIHLNYIGLFFKGKGIQKNPNAVLHGLNAVCVKSGITQSSIQGGLGYRIEEVGSLSDFRFAAELLEYGKNSFPQFRLFALSPEKADWSNAPSDELFSLFQTAHRHFEGLTKNGALADDIARSTVFHIDVGVSYFIEIAKLRALRLLWLHFQEAWGIIRSMPQVFVRFRANAFSEDIYTNMIRATSMAMSAVVGGANAIVVLPHDEGYASKNPYGEDFSKRIARNVQHLLKSESYMNRIVDPAAGSYYIEDLTTTIAEKAWKKIKETLT